MPEMSALFPMETNVDSPKPSSAACPMTAIPSAPLCERNPTRPVGGHVVANVPLSCTAGSVFTTPMQFGPISRIPDARHTSRSSRCNAAPSEPVSANPAEITTSPRTPFSPHSRATAMTCAAGTATNATST